MSNMKEINDIKIPKHNMKEKASIANKITYKNKTLENLSISRTIINDDKRNPNPNLKAVHEILALEKSYRKAPEINSKLSTLNDDRTLKEPYCSEINEKQNQEMNNIRHFKKFILFKVTFDIIALFIEKIIDIIHFIFTDFGIIDIILKIKSNSDIISFILASTLIICVNILNKIAFYINKIGVEFVRRGKILINPEAVQKIEIDFEKNDLFEMKNEYKNIQNIKEKTKLINKYNI